MASKKESKIVQITPQGAMLWDQPEAVRVVPPTVPASIFTQPSPARLAALRQRYRGFTHEHKQLIRDNAAGRFVASLPGNKENESGVGTPLA